jgi:hypothetical protein
MFQKLYAIERKARDKNLSPRQRHELRMEEALPLLNELGKCIVETYKFFTYDEVLFNVNNVI